MKGKYSQLKQIYEELKSKCHVRSSKRILTNNINKSNILISEIRTLLNHDKNLESRKLLEGANEIYQAIQQIVVQKRKTLLISFRAAVTAIIFTIKLSSIRTAKMASPLEIIKVASTLIPSFDGDPCKLEAIVSALKALKTVVTDTNETTAKNVVLAKLEGKARSAVGDDPQNIEEIIQKLTDKCRGTVAPETIVARLNAVKQIGEVTKFTQDIEKLTLELEKCYIAENIPVSTASKMATKAGIKTLANGIRCNESKLILKAGQFETLSSAIGKATENYNENTSTILNFTTNHNNQRGRRTPNRYRRYQSQFQSPRNNFRYNQRGNLQFNHRNEQHYNPPFAGRGDHRSRGNYGNRSNTHFRGRFSHQNNRVFYNQSENMPAPQAMSIGGLTGITGITGPAVELNQQQLPNQQVPLHHIQTA